jgi:hypothetical protein
MAERPRTIEVWRDAVVAGVRYYGVLGNLAVDAGKIILPAPGQANRTPFRRAARRPPPTRPSSAPATAPAAPAGHTMLLEGKAAQLALGVFLVENLLPERVLATVVASAFVDDERRAVRPTLGFDPEVIDLEPREQVLVRVAARMDDALEPGIRYRGDLSVLGLPGTHIPVVLFRRPDAA